MVNSYGILQISNILLILFIIESNDINYLNVPAYVLNVDNNNNAYENDVGSVIIEIIKNIPEIFAN